MMQPKKAETLKAARGSGSEYILIKSAPIIFCNITDVMGALYVPVTTLKINFTVGMLFLNKKLQSLTIMKRVGP